MSPYSTSGTNFDEELEAILARKLTFTEPYWHHISKEGKEFTARLLRINPARRPTAAEALVHPWIVRGKMYEQELVKRFQEEGEGTSSSRETGGSSRKGTYDSPLPRFQDRYENEEVGKLQSMPVTKLLPDPYLEGKGRTMVSSSSTVPSRTDDPSHQSQEEAQEEEDGSSTAASTKQQRTSPGPSWNLLFKKPASPDVKSMAESAWRRLRDEIIRPYQLHRQSKNERRSRVGALKGGVPHSSGERSGSAGGWTDTSPGVSATDTEEDSGREEEEVGVPSGSLDASPLSSLPAPSSRPIGEGEESRDVSQVELTGRRLQQLEMGEGDDDDDDVGYGGSQASPLS